MLRVTILLAALTCSLTVEAESRIPAELREAMRARHEAVCRIDAVTWDRLTANEFTVVVPEGKLLTKAQRLASLKTEQSRPVPAIQQEHIQRYGDTVVRRFMDDNEWILEVWVRQQDAWRVVAAQVNYKE